MSDIDHPALERAIRRLPVAFRGPGGAVGVVHDGAVVLAHAWGYADLARRRPMTTRTPLPICSISKQFTCGVLLDLVGDPSRLDDRVATFLPRLEDRRPSVAELCHMQSGLRDYWALTVLHGAQPEGVFAREDARPLLARMRTTHFAPGTSYSYSQRQLPHAVRHDRGSCRAQPRRALRRADVRAGRDGDGGADCRTRARRRTGSSATRGTATSGSFRRPTASTGPGTRASRRRSRTCWPGSATSTPRATTRAGLYRRLSAPPRFADGTPARYGYGLVHETVAGLEATGHGGALRGFRLQRLARAGAAALGGGAVQP